jgi:hypothetical protein
MESEPMNAKGIPTPICPACGSTLIRITAIFDLGDYEIAGYLLDDAECRDCGTELTPCTPLDLPSILR